MTPQAQRKQQETFEAGNYDVDGLEFFTKDANGVPFFKVETWKRKEVFVARYRTFQGEAKGPPGSIQPHEVALFAAAWGVNPAQLPKDRKQSLAVLEQLIQEAAQTVEVYVGKRGWVQSVTGMYLPIGKYLFHRQAITSRRDGEATWYDGDYGAYIRVGLAVASNADGTPSFYEGSTTDVWVMRKPMLILSALVPTRMDWLQTTDALALSTLETLLQAEIDTLVYGEVILKPGNKRPTLDATTLAAIPVNAIGKHPSTAVQPSAAPTPTTTTVLPAGWDASVAFLMRAIQAGVGASPAFVGDGRLTPEGKAWCRAEMGPVAKAGSLTNKFGEMTPEVVEAFLAGLAVRGLPVEKFLTEFRAAVTAEDGGWGDDDDTTWE